MSEYWKNVRYFLPWGIAGAAIGYGLYWALRLLGVN